MGQAMARAFLDEAADNFVWLGVHRHRDKALDFLKSFQERCQLLDLNVTDPDAWRKQIDCILAKHARVDVLINNAGAHHDSLLASMPANAWHEVVRTNLDGAFHGCQAVLPSMISQRRGSIVNVASISALLAPAGQANYAAAKAGVLALTRCLAKEVARIGITINAVCPGFIDTDALNSLTPDEKQTARMKIPMRRFGRAEEVAAAVLFLTCPAASYITGCILNIDGGIF